MTHELSNYELQRLETIRQNALYFEALGVQEARSDLHAITRKPKTIRSIRPMRGPTEGHNRRISRRLLGELPVDAEDVSDEESAIPSYRDCNDPCQMTAAELKLWCDRVREDVLKSSWVGSLNTEQIDRLHQANDSWLGPFAQFTARYGGKGEGPLSRQNLKSVLRQVMMLVSGAGITSNKRDGVFAEGRIISLGIRAEEVDHLRAEAQLWLPQERAPADLVGLRVNGSVIERKPPHGPFDSSNGWLLNHPLMKIRLYCEHLDEVRILSDPMCTTFSLQVRDALTVTCSLQVRSSHPLRLVTVDTLPAYICLTGEKDFSGGDHATLVRQRAKRGRQLA